MLWYFRTKRKIIFRDDADPSAVTYPTGASGAVVRVQIDDVTYRMSSELGAEIVMLLSDNNNDKGSHICIC